MGEIVKYPWEIQPPVSTTDETMRTVQLLQRDFAIAVQLTAVMVHSPHPGLQITVNTKRGQIIPRGTCKLTDGTLFQLTDIGMPQPNAPYATIEELMKRLWDVIRELGLEVVT